MTGMPHPWTWRCNLLRAFGIPFRTGCANRRASPLLAENPDPFSTRVGLTIIATFDYILYEHRQC